jgi:hypothetical protein
VLTHPIRTSLFSSLIGMATLFRTFNPSYKAI